MKLRIFFTVFFILLVFFAVFNLWHSIELKKIENELAYLRIAIDKTAGPTEIEAWTILMEKINKFLGKT